MRAYKEGFTLVELIVVVIIIAVLSSIGASLFSGANKKAILSEGITMLGTVRAAMRQYYVENGAYSEFIDTLGLSATDLNGIYFSHQCFGFKTCRGWRDGDPTSFLIFCELSMTQSMTSPKADVLLKTFNLTSSLTVPPKDYIAMDDQGNIYSDISDLGYSPAPTLPDYYKMW